MEDARLSVVKLNVAFKGIDDLFLSVFKNAVQFSSAIIL